MAKKLEFVLEQKGNFLLKASFPIKDRTLLTKELLRKGLLSRLRVFEYAVLMKLFSSQKASLKESEESFGMIIILLLSFSRKRRLEWNSFLQKALRIIRDMAGGDIANEILLLINDSWGDEHFLGKEFRSTLSEGVIFLEEIKEPKVRKPNRPRNPSSVGTKSSSSKQPKLPGETTEPTKLEKRISWEDNLMRATKTVSILFKSNANPWESDGPVIPKASDEERREFLETLKKEIFKNEKETKT